MRFDCTSCRCRVAVRATVRRRSSTFVWPRRLRQDGHRAQSIETHGYIAVRADQRCTRHRARRRDRVPCIPAVARREHRRPHGTPAARRKAFSGSARRPRLITLGAAAVFEVLAYYIPGVDHALDVLASPATVVAGIVASAAVITNLPPSVLWPIAIIGGGGVAGIDQRQHGAVASEIRSGDRAGCRIPWYRPPRPWARPGLSIFAIAVPVACLVIVVGASVLGGSQGRPTRCQQTRQAAT